MKIIVNGIESEVTANALPAILGELGYGEEKIATAVNGSFVAGTARPDVTLAPGDRLEVVTPRQGG